MTIIVGIACLAIGAVIGFLYRKSVSEKKISSAEDYYFSKDRRRAV